MPNVQPTTVTQALVNKAMSDPRFFAEMPEFLPLSIKLKTVVQPPIGRGCSSCQKRRLVQNIFLDFMNILSSLSPDALARLKQYYGIPAIIFNARDAQGRITLRVV
jgi:hypothetical protein